MMNQTTKTWLIAAAGLVLIGILAVGGVLSANHWDPAALSGKSFRTDTVEINESFRDITIRSDTEDIDFLASDDGRCRVVFYEKEKEKPAAFVHKGTLSIEVPDTGKWFERFTLFSFGSPRITVYLPQSAYGTLVIDESTGDVTLPVDFSFESIDINASTGNVVCCSSASGPIRIETSTGDIRLDGISADELGLCVSTGALDVRSAVCEGDFGVKVSTGRTVLTDVSCRNLVSEGSTGDIAMENLIAKERISVERSTGDVSFEQCDAAELLIVTDTGDVSGSLCSEKVFITQSDTGSVMVPGTTAGGICRITTDTGDIRIDIR